MLQEVGFLMQGRPGKPAVNRQRVLFLCTHNSARSEMAEGFLRSMEGDRFVVASAGTGATRVQPPTTPR